MLKLPSRQRLAPFLNLASQMFFKLPQDLVSATALPTIEKVKHVFTIKHREPVRIRLLFLIMKNITSLEIYELDQVFFVLVVLNDIPIPLKLTPAHFRVCLVLDYNTHPFSINLSLEVNINVPVLRPGTINNFTNFVGIDMLNPGWWVVRNINYSTVAAPHKRLHELPTALAEPLVRLLLRAGYQPANNRIL